MRVTVTIARQLGCGGSYIGHHIAEALQVRCIDREIVSRTAQRLSVDEAELAAREEKGASFWERIICGFTVGPPEAPYLPVAPSVTDGELFEHETEVMKSIATQEDCVIVGRAAAHVLPSQVGTINIFLFAPVEFRIPRVMEFYNAKTVEEARTMIERSDTVRGRFIMQMTGRNWDDAKNYHLCVDTSMYQLPDLAESLTQFVRRRSARMTNGT